MPVLHFLNVDYKGLLMEGVATLLQTTTDNLCIDGYDQNFVGEFEEGLALVFLYHSIVLSMYTECCYDCTCRMTGLLGYLQLIELVQT